MTDSVSYEGLKVLLRKRRVQIPDSEEREAEERRVLLQLKIILI